MTAKDRLHQLVDELPEGELSAAERFLQFLVGAVDHEPLTAEDWGEIREGLAEIDRGETVSWEEVKRSSGL